MAELHGVRAFVRSTVLDVNPLVLAVVLAALPPPAAGVEPPGTERYAPAQLSVARDLLERARAAAALGEAARAGELAWQANFDARLAWGMTRSDGLRAECVRVGREAAALVRRLGEARRAPLTSMD